MIIEEKKTESFVMGGKEQFETPAIEIILFESNDILTESGFPGDDDLL